MAGRRKKREIPPTRRGYQAYEVISALQKAIRRSQPKEAMYWAVELEKSGYGNWCWKRLRIILTEDIGVADRELPATIMALEQLWQRERKDKEGDEGGGTMYTMQAAALMAMAKKSRLICWAVLVMAGDHHERLEIPDEALDRHTLRGRRMGRRIEHFMDEAALLVDPPADMDDRLAELSVEYEDLFERMTKDDADLPDNPWGGRGRRQQEEQPPEGVTTHQLEGPGGQLPIERTDDS